jgi:hypothetical protein
MNNFLKQAALSYVAEGIPVFPCTPRGKRPIENGGFHTATLDPRAVAEWWDRYPNANIGIPTGAVSGFVVVDIDTGKGKQGKETLEELKTKGHIFPDTAEQTTGSGGTHLFYRHPGKHVKSVAGVFKDIDSRGDGGYIIAPPSIHDSGESYTWENEIDKETLKPIPDFWLEALETKEAETTHKSRKENNDYIEFGSRNDFLFREGSFYRRQGHGETAIFYFIKGLYEERCHKSPPIKDKELKEIASSCMRYQTFDQQFEEEIALGSKAAQNIIESHQQAIAEDMETDKTKKAGPAPGNLIPPEKNLIGDIARYILSQSRFPRQELAVAAATCYLGAIMGQKFKTDTGLRSNIYFVGLGKSGSGKDVARKLIKKVAHLTETTAFIGEERIASGPGLLSSLNEFPRKVFMLDEFGRMLQGITGKADSYKAEIMTNLMQLYSSAGSVFQGTAYADRQKNLSITLVDPCCVVYGTATHDSFFASLSSSETMGGEIARFLIMDAGKVRGKSVRYEEADPEEDLLTRIKQLHNYYPKKGNLNGLSKTIDAINVPMRPDVFDAWDELDNSLTDLMGDDASSSIYSRVAENTAKLALIYAVSKNHLHPVIDTEAFNWGRELALWSANTLMEHINSFVADNAQEADVKRVARIIKEFGKEGVKRNILTRKTQFLKKADRESILESLLEAGSVFKEYRGARNTEHWIHGIYHKK